MSERPTNRLVWIDCEMTGLELGSDLLIEVAALVTDGDLNILGEGVDVVVQATADQLADMLPVVRDMHGGSGLTQEVLTSTVTLREAEEAVLAYVREHVPEPGKAPLCGNSIATDRGFLTRDMPELDAWLHYRMVDVSSIKELARRWYPRAYYNAPKKGGGHRALADIRESVLELAYYRSVLFVPQPGPTSGEAAASAARLLGEAAAAGTTAVGASRLPEPAEQVAD